MCLRYIWFTKKSEALSHPTYLTSNDTFLLLLSRGGGGGVVGGNGIKAKLSQTELVWALTELGKSTYMQIADAVCYA